MRVAVDAQIVLRNHARRMVFAAAESAGWDVLLPETTVIMAKTHYGRVSTQYVTNQVTWEIDLAEDTLDEEEVGHRIHERLERLTIGFAAWIDAEPKRNDRVFEVAPRTRQAKGLAMELAKAQVVVDPKDTRWGIGEDPYVLAEALCAGAHWIASANFTTLKPATMERWLDRAQAKGRFPHVPRPFILDPDTAVATILRHGHGVGVEVEVETLTRALAHAVSEPNDPTASLQRRLSILGRFALELRDCGMSESGEAIRAWSQRAAARMKTGRNDRVWDDIDRMRRLVGTETVRRTREAETRRMHHEHHGAMTPRVRTRQTPRGGPER